MKILTWFLVVFSTLALLGIFVEAEHTSASFWGALYAGLVLAQGVLVLQSVKKVQE